MSHRSSSSTQRWRLGKCDEATALSRLLSDVTAFCTRSNDPRVRRLGDASADAKTLDTMRRLPEADVLAARDRWLEQLRSPHLRNAFITWCVERR